jgi:hypothetical protein
MSGCSSCPGKTQAPPVPEGHQTPGMLHQVSTAMTAAARFVLSGMKTLPMAEQQARMDVCSGCNWKRDDQCLACGCVLSIKSWLPGEFCPHGLWPKSN